MHESPAPDQLLVRAARETDVPAIAAIYAPAVLQGLASFELVPPDAAEMLTRMETMLAGGHPYLVAEAGGEVLGYAYAGPYRSRPAYDGTVEDAVYVAARAQGRGVGRALLSALVAEAEARGFRQMIAVIGDSGNAASIGLHRALGFHFAGVLHAVGRKHGRWLDSVLMQRALGAGDAAAPAVEPGRP